MIPLHQGVNRYSFVGLVDVPLRCHHERDLARLEVEVHWGEDRDDRFSRVTVIISTILGLNISIKIALGHTVDVHRWLGQIGRDFDDELAVSQNVGFREIISETQGDLEGTRISHWQFYRLDHGMQSHFPDVASCGVDFQGLSMLFHKPSILPVG